MAISLVSQRGRGQGWGKGIKYYILIFKSDSLNLENALIIFFYPKILTYLSIYEHKFVYNLLSFVPIYGTENPNICESI